ncbi:MAG: DUF1178 family protein [Azospirillum sp.]|nr:DUF1178 family protein [Azospirillum sp.]
MILFQLKCGAEHQFEAWFRDGAAWENRSAGSIACPVCGDTAIAKAPMAPRISRHAAVAPAAAQAPGQDISQQIQDLRKKVEETCEHVGDRFAEEARRIHYGETARRDIYGEATNGEAEQLREEGVAFCRIPWPRPAN